MIKLTTELGFTHTLKPTIFPDGTSQVWKLPDEILGARDLEITWNFEAEREVIDLLSLRRLLVSSRWDLHIPFLPYARQDKNVDNSSTFNLIVLAELINLLGCRSVTAVDVHNPEWTAELIKNFENIEVTALQQMLLKEKKINFVVYPDKGAFHRYNKLECFAIVCDKVRDQATGNITGHKIDWCPDAYLGGPDPSNILIIDDLCDGGATFISVAKLLRQEYNYKIGNIDLFVTHGVFSKGREHLLNNGISNVYTTNSLTKNGDGYQV